jgi:hypothetical protein
MIASLDPAHPPKHCPDCKAKGNSSKVRVFQLNLDYEGVILCENKLCKWPLNRFKSDSYLVADTRKVAGKKKEKSIPGSL